MGKIQALSDIVIAQISAGEVVESPVNVIKELIENSLDANSTKIEIFIESNGFDKVIVRDNGHGISHDDLPLALVNFTTSKLHKTEDLLSIETMGFRGEALGSIRSVSKLTIESSHYDLISEEQQRGYSITGYGSEIKEVTPAKIPTGTQITVSDLFFNMPVRKASFKSTRTLPKQILELISAFALAHPQITWSYILDNKKKLLVKKTKHLSSRIEEIYSHDFMQGLIPVYSKEDEDSELGEIILEGYISNFDFYKTNGSYMKLFINQRMVSYKSLFSILRSVYGELMPPGRFPVAFLFMKINPQYVDINVHPQKKEIRFKNSNKVYSFLLKAIRKHVEQRGLFRVKDLTNPKKNRFQNLDDKYRIEVEKFKQKDFLPPLEIQDDKRSFAINIQSKDQQSKNTIGILNEWDNKLKQEIKTEINSIPLDEIPEVTHCILFNTFILASSSEGLFLIDQHTAHERINYEKFLQKLNEQKSTIQHLLSPISFFPSPAEKEAYLENRSVLSSLGFIIEDLGPAGFSLRSIPFYVARNQEEEALAIALKFLEKTDSNVTAITLFDEIAKSLACRASIKKGEKESMQNIKELVEQLLKCKVPVRCPHGRPTIVFLNKVDIFNLFKRFQVN